MAPPSGVGDEGQASICSVVVKLKRSEFFCVLMSFFTLKVSFGVSGKWVVCEFAGGDAAALRGPGGVASSVGIAPTDEAAIFTERGRACPGRSHKFLARNSGSCVNYATRSLFFEACARGVCETRMHL